MHVAAGELTTSDVAAVRAARPDLVLLVGGTDGGNGTVLLHNAARLAKGALGGHGSRAVPVVVAGNVDVRDEVAATLATTDRPTVLADNVLPQIGVIAPESARAAIREAFLRHVIGGKGLSRDPPSPRWSRRRRPTSCCAASRCSPRSPAVGDVMVVDIGGATTDVYSCLTPEGEDAGLRKDVVAPLWHARTVEGDLGMRWNAEHVVEAAESEHLLGTVPDADALRAYAARVHERPGSLPVDDDERGLDLELARLAALVAVRRHARPAQPTESPRPLANVTALVGSGGVLRHGGRAARDHVLGAVLADHAGGWKVPRAARAGVDTAYLLFAAGLLAADERTHELARAVAAQITPEPSKGHLLRVPTVERPPFVGPHPSRGHRSWVPTRRGSLSTPPCARTCAMHRRRLGARAVRRGAGPSGHGRPGPATRPALPSLPDVGGPPQRRDTVASACRRPVGRPRRGCAPSRSP